MSKSSWPRVIVFLIFVAFTFAFSASHVQAVSYSPIYGDNAIEWITNVTFGNIDNTAQQDPNGYGDYTYGTAGFVTFVAPGGIYPLEVTIHPDSQWCREYINAFFDWNRNGRFIDPGEKVVVETNTCLPGPHPVNIRVPDGVASGEIRMRVVLKYDGSPSSYGSIPEGEAEDYTIVVAYPDIIGDTRHEWITNVTFGDIINDTGYETNGYGDYTYWKSGKITEVIKGETYPLSVTINPYTVLPCSENVSVFFDWNHDGDFNDFREDVPVVTDTCDSGPHTVDVKVPSYASLGTARMRVVLNYFFSPQGVGQTSGEAEDYTVNVVGGGFPIALFLPAIIKK